MKQPKLQLVHIEVAKEVLSAAIFACDLGGLSVLCEDGTIAFMSAEQDGQRIPKKALIPVSNKLWSNRLYRACRDVVISLESPPADYIDEGEEFDFIRYVFEKCPAVYSSINENLIQESITDLHERINSLHRDGKDYILRLTSSPA